MYCQSGEDEGLSSMCIDNNAQLLIVGTSKGFVKVFLQTRHQLIFHQIIDVNKFHIVQGFGVDYSKSCTHKHAWRAHVGAIRR